MEYLARERASIVGRIVDQGIGDCEGVGGVDRAVATAVKRRVLRTGKNSPVIRCIRGSKENGQTRVANHKRAELPAWKTRLLPSFSPAKRIESSFGV